MEGLWDGGGRYALCVFVLLVNWFPRVPRSMLCMFQVSTSSFVWLATPTPIVTQVFCTIIIII